MIDETPRRSGATSRGLAFAPALLVALCVLGAGIYVDHLNTRRFLDDARLEVLDTLSVVRARLEGTISGNIQLVRGLVAAIMVEPDMSQERFTDLAIPLIGSNSQLRNIGAAPDLVISLMAPLDGNQQAIGLDLRANRTQREAAERARDTGDLVLAGPITLVQGGQGFIGRIPVLLPDGEFWGLVSAVIDAEALYEASGLLDPSLPIEVAIRGKDATGAAGPLFFGDGGVLAANPTLADVTLPSGSWQMAAIPRGGWPRQAPDAWALRAAILVAGLLMVVSTGAVGALLVARRTDVDRLRHASRTLAASEARLRRLLQESPIGISIVDRETQERLYVNPALLGMLGAKSADALLPRAIGTPWADREEFTRVRRAVDAGDLVGLEARMRRLDGTEWWALLSTHPIDFQGRPARVNWVSDITDRREADKAVRASEARLASILETSPIAVNIVDDRGRFRFFNERMVELFGHPRDVLLETNAADLYVDVADRAAIFDEVHRQGWARDREVRFRSADGTPFWALVSVFRAPEEARFVGWIYDVSGLKQTQAELARAKEAADTANRAKSDFLSSMSHDLRTPLTAILGFSQLLQSPTVDPSSPLGRRHLALIENSGRHLLRLVDDILDLARIEAGEIEIELRNMSVGALLDDCLPDIEAPAAQRGITLVRPPTEDLEPVIRADPTRARQVLLNLLSNAVKYNREGGSISLTVVTRRNGRCRVCVADTGAGIPPERRDELFKPFSRLGAERTEIEGTGIGLSFSRRLMEEMGGRLGYESTPGQGSIFWAEFETLAERTAPAAEPAVTESPEPETTAVAPSAAVGPVRTVLYIEDNAVNRYLLDAIFDSLPGYRLILADTGTTGLAAIAHERPDAVLLDLDLPDMPGLRVLHEIRQSQDTATLPVIALSADALAETRERALSAGIDGFLTKPVDIAAMTGMLDRVLGVED